MSAYKGCGAEVRKRWLCTNSKVAHQIFGVEMWTFVAVALASLIPLTYSFLPEGLESHRVVSSIEDGQGKSTWWHFHGGRSHNSGGDQGGVPVGDEGKTRDLYSK